MKLKDYLYYSEKGIKLYNADCLDVMRKLPDNYIDLIVTDPPYQLNSIRKRFGKKGSAKAQWGKDGAFRRVSKGFMGKKWDVLPPVETWKECLRVLKPGAFAFIMTTPRQDSLCQILTDLSQAGFNMGFSSIYHSYATGFPKANNISKMVDKRGAVLPDDLRKFKKWFRKQLEKSSKTQQQINKECGFTAISYYKTDGKDYWTSAFPTEEKWVKIKQVMNLSNKWDKLIKRYDKERGFIEPTGNLHQADKTKSIKFSGKQLSNKPYSKKAKELSGSFGGFQPKPAVEIIIVAMKPLSEKTYVDQALKNKHGITWLGQCRVPYNSKKDIIPQIRENKRKVNAGKMYRGNSLLKSKTEATIGGSKKGRFPANLLVSDDVLNDGKITKASKKSKGCGKGDIWNKFVGKPAGDTYGDEGSYSRYFSLDSWWQERLKKLPESVRKVFPFLIVPKASKRLETKQYGNIHPTCKPIKLMSYLITLGSRENDIILDPFAGSGTTLIASKILNRKGIGIELNKEYCGIAKHRIKGNQ